MNYKSNSPYYDTKISSDDRYLDLMISRVVPASSDDDLLEINPTYNLRPDLLANDLYNDSGLWWVFIERNPNTLEDPIGDFVTGTSIYLPNATALKQSLGL